MRDRFLHNNQNDCIYDSLQEVDLTTSEINKLLNDLSNNNRELESDDRYYRALYDMYERNYIELKKRVEGLIDYYRDCMISDSGGYGSIYKGVVEDLEGLFEIK